LLLGGAFLPLGGAALRLRQILGSLGGGLLDLLQGVVQRVGVELRRLLRRRQACFPGMLGLVDALAQLMFGKINAAIEQLIGALGVFPHLIELGGKLFQMGGDLRQLAGGVVGRWR